MYEFENKDIQIKNNNIKIHRKKDEKEKITTKTAKCTVGKTKVNKQQTQEEDEAFVYH